MGITLWAVAILLLVERLGKLWLVVRFFRQPSPPLRQPPRRVSILQPILSGDPTLPACLAHNVAVMDGLVNWDKIRSDGGRWDGGRVDGGRWDGGTAGQFTDSSMRLDSAVWAAYTVEFHWLVDEADGAGQAICRAIMERYPQMAIRLMLLPPAPQGQNPKTVKLIAALPHTTGDVIVVLDDDTMLPADGVAQALPYLDTERAGLVFGLPYQVDFANLWSRLVALFVNSSSLLTYVPYLALSEPLTINGMFYLMRRDVLDAVGSFAGLEPVLADDFAVAQRFRQAGYRLVQSPLRHAVSNHVASGGAYWRLLTRWLTFPRESLLRHLSWREQVLLYANTLIPTLAPLLLLMIGLVQQSGAWLALAVGYLVVSYLIFLWLDRVYLYRATPRRWSWLTVVAQLLLPLQLLTAFLLPQRINWRGHLMQVERGGGFRFVRRR
jgi:ceramide glucosyltransferase